MQAHALVILSKALDKMVHMLPASFWPGMQSINRLVSWQCCQQLVCFVMFSCRVVLIFDMLCLVHQVLQDAELCLTYMLVKTCNADDQCLMVHFNTDSACKVSWDVMWVCVSCRRFVATEKGGAALVPGEQNFKRP